MNQRERYQALYRVKLQELVETRDKAEKLEHQVNLLKNWLAVEELKAEAKALDSSVQSNGEKKP